MVDCTAFCCAIVWILFSPGFIVISVERILLIVALDFFNFYFFTWLTNLVMKLFVPSASCQQSNLQIRKQLGMVYWQMVSCHLFSSCLDMAACQRHHDIITAVLWSKPSVTLKTLGIMLLVAYFARIFWGKGMETRNLSMCHICPSSTHFYGEWQMCSSILTVSLLLVANLNFEFKKLYRLAMKPYQFYCTSFTVISFWFYSTNVGGRVFYI